MWTTLALTALSLAPGQTGELNLANIRSTYGYLGAPRTETKLIPGDVYFVVFDIENIKVSDKTGEIGEVHYSMAMELTDSTKKIWYKQEPRELRALNSLGGNSLPAFAHVEVGLEQPPEHYFLKVTVTDLAAKTSKSFTREFQVIPTAFGLVRVNLSSDPAGRQPAPYIGLAGQSVWVNFLAVGFDLSPKKLPDMTVEMQVVDENDKPTLSKPLKGEVKDKDQVQGGKAVPMQFYLALNRPGTFTVKLKATDNVSKKTAAITFPIKVLESK